MSDREKVAKWLVSNLGLVWDDIDQERQDFYLSEADELRLLVFQSDREALDLAIGALNRCAAIANSLNPEDPVPAKTAFRELWDALGAISAEWPIDDLDPVKAVLSEGSAGRIHPEVET